MDDVVMLLMLNHARHALCGFSIMPSACALSLIFEVLILIGQVEFFTICQRQRPQRWRMVEFFLQGAWKVLPHQRRLDRCHRQ